MKINKRGWILQETIMYMIIIVLVLVGFMFALEAKVGSRGVAQQVLEKELALLIDAAVEGSRFGVGRDNADGIVDSVEVRDGRVYVSVDGFRSGRGYPYFSEYELSVEEDDAKFVVVVG